MRRGVVDDGIGREDLGHPVPRPHVGRGREAIEHRDDVALVPQST